MILDRYAFGLAIVSALGGLALQWLNHRRNAASSLIKDFETIRKALKEENERLGLQIDQLRKELENEMLKRVALEERLTIERDIFSRRMAVLESQLNQLGAA